MNIRKRRGAAEVVGAIFFIIIALSVFALLAALVSAQYSLARAEAAAQQIVGYKADESLAVTLSGTTMTISNNGPTTADVSYYIGITSTGQKMAETIAPVSVAPRGSVTVSVGNYQTVGAVTSFGNIWWS